MECRQLIAFFPCFVELINSRNSICLLSCFSSTLSSILNSFCCLFKLLVDQGKSCPNRDAQLLAPLLYRSMEWLIQFQRQRISESRINPLFKLALLNTQSRIPGIQTLLYYLTPQQGNSKTLLLTLLFRAKLPTSIGRASPHLIPNKDPIQISCSKRGFRNVVSGHRISD